MAALSTSLVLAHAVNAATVKLSHFDGLLRQLRGELVSPRLSNKLGQVKAVICKKNKVIHVIHVLFS